MKKTLININPIKDLIKDKLIEKYDNTVYMNTNSIDIKLDIKDIIEDYVKELELPENLEPINILAVGYSDELTADENRHSTQRIPMDQLVTYL